MRLMGILPSVMRSSFGGGKSSGGGDDTPLPLTRGTVDEGCLASVALSKLSVYDLVLLLLLLWSILLAAAAVRAWPSRLSPNVLSSLPVHEGRYWGLAVASGCPDGCRGDCCCLTRQTEDASTADFAGVVDGSRKRGAKGINYCTPFLCKALHSGGCRGDTDGLGLMILRFEPITSKRALSGKN